MLIIGEMIKHKPILARATAPGTRAFYCGVTVGADWRRPRAHLDLVSARVSAASVNLMWVSTVAKEARAREAARRVSTMRHPLMDDCLDVV